MMAKPMKTLELYYPMIQFLIMRCSMYWNSGWRWSCPLIGYSNIIYSNIYICMYVCRKSASRFSRGTVLNTLKQSRINIMRGKKDATTFPDKPVSWIASLFRGLNSWRVKLFYAVKIFFTYFRSTSAHFEVTIQKLEIPVKKTFFFILKSLISGSLESSHLSDPAGCDASSRTVP